MKRLWDKGGDCDPTVHKFTVGDDPLLDLRLIHFDCLGSIAHVRTLQRAGLLGNDEANRLAAELVRIDALASAGKFSIPEELEDCHTAIENHLIAALGELGEKIHAGRSRNDQVATAVRLFMRHHVIIWTDEIAALISVLIERIRRDGKTPMPGYTHARPAMPSSVGLWLHSFAEALLDQLRAAVGLLDQIDSCPLGTGAGYGVPLPLDRTYSAALLGFSRVQRNPLDVQNSRGRLETCFVRVAADTAAVLEKLGGDLILFSTVEFGFFGLPDAFTTGSSIMPQKRNPDVLELMRARAVRLRSRQHELEWLAAKLPSGYHRDFQLLKCPAIEVADQIVEMLAIMRRVISEFTIHRDRLAAAMRPDLFATQAALELARTGVPFRQAYRQIAERLQSGSFVPPNPRESLRHDGLEPGMLETTEDNLRTLGNAVLEYRRRVSQTENNILSQHACLQNT
jgi:argininosuccinate lyase